ncbi:MAG TPA: type I glyceraldehyde-3-phosphate dehydrogenase [Flavobacteriaceae bacterium]|nr:type I glyceraldehyde-3-phosphate dehydrogenase [Flavobacteriaceae bacterium]
MPKQIKVAINGFGRIGRSLFRLLLDHSQIEVVVINELADAKMMAHLLKYDSVHGVLKEEVSSDEGSIIVGGKHFPMIHHKAIEEIPWKDYEVDVVVECTGKFKTRKELELHLKSGANKVLLSVPPKDDCIKTMVLGVNDDILENDDRIVSNASCTTNNAAPMLKIVHDALGVEQAYISTIHSFTSDQNLHDQPHRDFRRARSAPQSIIPTTTGAAKALTKIFPDLSEVIGGCGIRVPVANGSLTDMTINVKKKTSIEEINNLFKQAAKKEFKGIIQYMEDPIVSVDILGSPYSCIFDEDMTSVIDSHLVKLIGWYDNEYGYSNRLVDLILKVGK